MTKAPEIKSPADLLPVLREFGTQHLTALNTLHDKADETSKPVLAELRDQMKTLVEKLPSFDGTTDVTTALNSFARCFSELFNFVETSRAKIAELSGIVATKSTALNGFEEQVKSGALVSKDKVELATTAAADEAKKPLVAEIATLRREQFALCGLPPAPDSVLNSNAADFAASLTQAKKNLADLKAKGVVLGGKGDAFLKKSAWLNQEAFNGEVKAIEDLAPGLKLNLGGKDPMIGAPGGDKKAEDAGGDTKRKLTLA
jgi:hypothetical protein